MPTDSAAGRPALVLALGGFDGVHLGHQQIIRRCRELARRHQALAGVLTFDPLPAQLVYPDFTYVLTPLAEKTALLTELGIELIHAIRFTAAVRNTSAEEFVRNQIIAPLQPVAVIVGHDHRFGAEGSGDVRLLGRLLAGHRIRLEVVPEFIHRDAPVRSTRIREHLLLGHVALAAELLGRPYALGGKIIPGTATGRRLGFPTINIQPREPEKLIPADGVYTVLLDLRPSATLSTCGEGRGEDRPSATLSTCGEGRGEDCRGCISRRYPAVLNIGHRPTFNGDRRTIEAHIIDLHEPVSGEQATINFLDRLRPERRFAGPAELAAQIGLDIENARNTLRNLDTAPPADV